MHRVIWRLMSQRHHGGVGVGEVVMKEGEFLTDEAGQARVMAGAGEILAGATVAPVAPEQVPPEKPAAPPPAEPAAEPETPEPAPAEPENQAE